MTSLTAHCSGRPASAGVGCPDHVGGWTAIRTDALLQGRLGSQLTQLVFSSHRLGRRHLWRYCPGIACLMMQPLFSFIALPFDTHWSLSDIVYTSIFSSEHLDLRIMLH